MRHWRSRLGVRFAVTAVVGLTPMSSGCTQTVAPEWSDGADPSDAANDDARADVPAPSDGGNFCSDPNSARLAVNGVVAESPAASATQLYLDCCDSAVIHLITARFVNPISVMWRRIASAAPSPVMTVDLAHLPPEWSVSAFEGCYPPSSSCTPIDRYDTGFTGSLRITRTSGGQFEMALCLQANETATMPHASLHSLQIWVPSVTSTP